MRVTSLLVALVAACATVAARADAPVAPIKVTVRLLSVEGTPADLELALLKKADRRPQETLSFGRGDDVLQSLERLRARKCIKRDVSSTLVARGDQPTTVQWSDADAASPNPELFSESLKVMARYVDDSNVRIELDAKVLLQSGSVPRRVEVSTSVDVKLGETVSLSGLTQVIGDSARVPQQSCKWIFLVTAEHPGEESAETRKAKGPALR